MVYFSDPLAFSQLFDVFMIFYFYDMYIDRYVVYITISHYRFICIFLLLNSFCVYFPFFQETVSSYFFLTNFLIRLYFLLLNLKSLKTYFRYLSFVRFVICTCFFPIYSLLIFSLSSHGIFTKQKF